MAISKFFTVPGSVALRLRFTINEPSRTAMSKKLSIYSLQYSYVRIDIVPKSGRMNTENKKCFDTLDRVNKLHSSY